MAEQRHNAAFIVGAILGGVAGAAVTLWTTPRSGIELRTRMMGEGDDYVPGVAMSEARGDAVRRSSRVLGAVERAAAPLVGVRLGQTGQTGQTAEERRAAAAESGEEIVVPVGEASGEPTPGDTGPGHAASTEELTSPPPDAVEQPQERGTDRFTPFPHGELPPNPPR